MNRSRGDRLRRLEAAIGARRGQRSLWVWAVPVLSTAIPFALTLWMMMSRGNVGLDTALPAALIAGLFMGGLSAMYMSAGDDAEDRGPDED